MPSGKEPPKWAENTAATPPVFKLKPAVLVQLDESFNLQVQSDEKVKVGFTFSSDKHNSKGLCIKII